MTHLYINPSIPNVRNINNDLEDYCEFKSQVADMATPAPTSKEYASWEKSNRLITSVNNKELYDRWASVRHYIVHLFND